MSGRMLLREVPWHVFDGRRKYLSAGRNWINVPQKQKYNFKMLTSIKNEHL